MDLLTHALVACSYASDLRFGLHSQCECRPLTIRNFNKISITIYYSCSNLYYKCQQPYKLPEAQELHEFIQQHTPSIVKRFCVVCVVVSVGIMELWTCAYIHIAKPKKGGWLGAEHANISIYWVPKSKVLSYWGGSTLYSSNKRYIPIFPYRFRPLVSGGMISYLERKLSIG